MSALMYHHPVTVVRFQSLLYLFNLSFQQIIIYIRSIHNVYFTRSYHCPGGC
jgi:hypothetical protein